MTMIKGSSKKGEKIINMYNRYDGFTLDDVYGRCSSAKGRAWDECFQWFKDDDGDNFHICSHCTNTFTVGWRYIDKDTGHEIIRVETAKNTYKVDTAI